MSDEDFIDDNDLGDEELEEDPSDNEDSEPVESDQEAGSNPLEEDDQEDDVNHEDRLEDQPAPKNDPKQPAKKKSKKPRSQLDVLMKAAVKKKRKKMKLAMSEFFDDEAELSDDERIKVSDDESDVSDSDAEDEQLVDKDAPELDSDEEEEIRGLYHKQLEKQDKRDLLVLQEQLEEKDVNIGQRRRRKFRWQTRELIDNSLKRHYDPDDDESEGDNDDDAEYYEYDETKSRIRRPTGDALLIGSTIATSNRLRRVIANEDSSDDDEPIAGSSSAFFEDSNSMTSHPMINPNGASMANTDMNKYLYRDKEIVQALSTRETIIMTREEKDRLVKREFNKVLQSKSIFDQLYS